MAIDQTPSTTPDPSALPAIENEFPTYRAISPAAVMSLICGLASVFSFADLSFLLLVAVAIILGLVSLRQIRRLPEVLTGSGIARVGIGTALLFGLSAVTQVVTQEVQVNLDAGRFAKLYTSVIKDEPVSVSLWYEQPTTYRKEKSPDELVEEMKNTKTPSSPDAFLEKAGPILKIKDRLKGQGETIQYYGIESKAIEGLSVYANALIKLEGPGSKEFPDKEEYALARMVKGPDAGPLDWVVQELLFPYKPKSTVATIPKKADDDGHGH